MPVKKPRIMLYSHDTFGLGHLRRSLSVAGQIARDVSGSHQLLLTGSMVAGAFGLPPRLDMVKLPALSKRSSGQYKARALPLTLKQTMTWREQMILQAAVNFQPHLLLVDKVPGGVHGELLPALRHLRTWSPETRLVLGMRDIEDSPAKTRAEWSENDTAVLHNDVYDLILFYGERAVFDPVSSYGMSVGAAAKLVETGYLRRDNPARTPNAVRRELNIGDQPLVLVTVGGGGDGYEIIETYLQMLREQDGRSANGRPPIHTVIVTGPLMARRKRAVLRQAAQAGMTLLEFTPDLLSYMAAADLVVSMAGYNTVCEILSLGKRAILIPRVRTRLEQLIRAQRLTKRGLVTMIRPSALTPARLHDNIHRALAAPAPTVDLNLNGLKQVGQTINDLLAPLHKKKREDRARARKIPLALSSSSRF